MILNIPRYENGNKWWDKNDSGYDLDTSKCVEEINSIDDFINSYERDMKLDKIEDYFNIIDEINKLQIENTTHIKFYVDRLKNFIIHFNSATKEMPPHIKEIYSEKLKPLIEEIKKIIRLNRTFIINNRDEIINRTNEIINGLINKKKEAQAKANKKYYEKNKELFNSIAKPVKTIEEKKEARALANKKYYEKNKELFNSIAKPVKTEEEKKEARILANKKYYQSKKELLKQLELLKSQNV